MVLLLSNRQNAMSLRPIVAILASAALVFVLVPVFASAQYVSSYPTSNCGVYPYTTPYDSTYPYSTTDCGQGNLLVYVQVDAPEGQPAPLPSAFTVNIIDQDQTPSPASF